MRLSEQVIDPRVRAPGTVMSQTPPPQTVVSRKSEVSMVVARAPGLTVGVLDPAIAQRLNVQTMKSLQGLSAARDLAPQK
jgi:beta-lactam-binding protein with PASTA domain